MLIALLQPGLYTRLQWKARSDPGGGCKPASGYGGLATESGATVHQNFLAGVRFLISFLSFVYLVVPQKVTKGRCSGVIV